MKFSRMEAKTSKLLLWTAVAALLSHNLVISAANFDDQKTYYPPDPNAHSPPIVSSTPPGHATPTPSHGTPPSHGGGSYGGTPPVNCGNPPSGGGAHDPPSSGGGHTTPAPPTGGGGGGHHTTPAPPTGGGGSGGYYHSPPTSTPTTPIVYPPPLPIVNPPTTPIVYPPPLPIVNPPSIITPPTTPIVTPGTPGITIPSPSFPFDPNSPPFSCNYWRNHPTLVWGLIGWWGTVGNAFSLPSNLPGLGSNMNLVEALSNTRSDGIGELYRQGTAALLNSMAAHGSRFPYTTSQVRDSFVAALSSNRAASAQARLFKLANEGRTKTRT